MNFGGLGMGILRKRQHGSAAVEFTFVFPLLFMLVYGVITYSFLFLLTTAVPADVAALARKLSTNLLASFSLSQKH